MHNLHMNLAQLRTFVIVADAGGVTRAVARLRLSQPAISRQILALEDDLGLALFFRVGRQVRLTPDGEDLLRRSRRLLSEAESLRERAHTLKQGQTGLLRVGATPQVIETLLANFLPLHRRRHPGVDIHLVEDGGARLPDRLARGDMRLAIIPAGDDRFAARALFPMQLIAILPADHPKARRRVLDIVELADEPLLLLGQGFASRAWFDAACKVAQIAPQMLLESAAPQTLIALARTGYGVAVVPSNVRISRETVRVTPLVHRGASLGKWAVAAWDVQRLLPPYGERFVQELETYCLRASPGRNLTRGSPALPRS
jgi:LysR family cyn operon transcriptional activator